MDQTSEKTHDFKYFVDLNFIRANFSYILSDIIDVNMIGIITKFHDSVSLFHS